MAFVDTLYFVALFNPRDQWHGRAVAASKLIADTKLITTEEVLVELLNWLCTSNHVCTMNMVLAR